MGKFKNILIKIHDFFVTDKQQWIEHLKRTSVVLFDLSILLLPFNGLLYFPQTREFGWSGSKYPMYLACIVVLIYKLLSHTKYRIPHNKLFRSFIIGIGFIAIFGAIVAIFTLSIGSGNSYQLFINTEHLVYREALLLLFTIFSITIYNIVVDSKISLERIRTKYIQSFYIPAVYSLFEIVYIYTGYLSAFLQKTSPFLRLSLSTLYLQLHSVSSEPAWFGVYIGGLLPWLCSYWFQQKNDDFSSKLAKYILYPYLIFITILTSSRFAYAIIIFGILLFTAVFLFRNNNQANRKLVLRFVLYTTIILACSMISLKLNKYLTSDNKSYRNPINTAISLKLMGSSIFSIYTNKNENLLYAITPSSDFKGSNITRIGGALAAINIAKHYPLTGVGIGQYNRYIYAYSSEAYKNNPEVINNVLKQHDTTNLSSYNLLARIASDEGFVGLGVFFSCFLMAIIYIYNHLKAQNIVQLSLLISFCIFLVYMFNSDSYTSSEYWLILPLTWIYFDFNTHNK